MASEHQTTSPPRGTVAEQHGPRLHHGQPQAQPSQGEPTVPGPRNRLSRAQVLRQSRFVDPLRATVPLLGLLLRHARRPVRMLTRAWRRSIQLRLVATTLLLSLGVVLLLGVVVIGQVRNGLLEAKRQSAQSQALGGFKAAQDQALASQKARSQGGSGDPVVDGGVVDSGTWLNDLVEQLASGGQGQYAVVTLGSDFSGQSPFVDPSPGTRSARYTENVDPDRSIPDELREALDREEQGVYERYTTIVRVGGSEREPALVVGKRLTDVNNNPYQLYYVFPFTQEEDTLNLVKGTLATAGVFVVVLLGAIAWLVARQVVTPVRMAVRIAERLAAGRLQERMKVTGEDDIARLGQSFNKMAQNLQTKIVQLEELSRMQRRFVSDVSHELRTPLTTVRMAADVLHDAREDFDPVTKRSAELLGTQLDRFESLLADLLEISRFDAGAAALDAEPVDLRDVVHRVLEAAEPLAERKGSALVVRGTELPVVAEVDARRVERVLRNLVVNAVEHGEGRDVVVRLAVAQDNSAVAVAVRDYGVGLKPGESSRVFNRFWRGDPARARTTGGTGLGLSIALEDARLHGGWLQAWGEPGGGSQFRLTLPATAGATLRGAPLPLEPADSRRNRAVVVSGSAPLTPATSSGAVRHPERRGRPGHEVRTVPRQPNPALLPVPPRPGYPPPPAVGPARLPGNDGGDGATVSRVVDQTTLAPSGTFGTSTPPSTAGTDATPAPPPPAAPPEAAPPSSPSASQGPSADAPAPAAGPPQDSREDPSHAR